MSEIKHKEKKKKRMRYSPYTLQHAWGIQNAPGKSLKCQCLKNDLGVDWHADGKAWMIQGLMTK